MLLIVHCIVLNSLLVLNCLWVFAVVLICLVCVCGWFVGVCLFTGILSFDDGVYILYLIM